MPYGEAQFVGPTPAQLQQQSDKQFQEGMLGIASMLSSMTQQKQAQAKVKAELDQKTKEDAIKNSWDMVNSAIAATITKSVNEVAKNPAGQQLLYSHYKLMYSDEQARNLVGMLASNRFDGDQILTQQKAQYANEQLAKAGGGQPGTTGTTLAQGPSKPPTPSPQVSQPESSAIMDLLGAAAPVAAAPVAAAPVAAAPAAAAPAAAAPVDPKEAFWEHWQQIGTKENMGALLGKDYAWAKQTGWADKLAENPANGYSEFVKSLTAPAAAAPAVATPAAPVPAAPTPTPQEQRKQQVVAAQAKDSAVQDARQQAKTIAQQNPSAAQTFLQQVLAPDSLYLQLKAFEKDPNKYMEDTNPDTIRKLQADIDLTTANARKLGLEGDEAVIKLAQYKDELAQGINESKARTLMYLKQAAATTLNAKVASVYYQMNNAVLSQAMDQAKTYQKQANDAKAAAEKAGKDPTSNDVASWNASVSMANAALRQANQIAANLQGYLTGSSAGTPQFTDIPPYSWTKKGGVTGGLQNFFEFVGGGQGAISGTALQGAPVVPGAAPVATGGVGVPLQAGAQGVAVGTSTGPSLTPEEQAAMDQIIKDMSKKPVSPQG